MNDETKKRIKSYLETIKDYEVHGGEPADYKENLVNLREFIKKGLFEEKDSKRTDILFYALKEVNNNISVIDTLRSIGPIGKGSDKLIKDKNIIQTLSSMLFKDYNILFLEFIVSEV